MTGTILTEMQNEEYAGMVLVGHPGAAKSAIAKATGNEAGVPTVIFDLSSMKASLVGESNARLRQALKTVKAISQGKALFIATCNSLAALPPELKRRYSLGFYFFDLPDSDERAKIWSIYLKKYGLPSDPSTLPDDTGWTGAEIKNCAHLAWRMRTTPKEAADYITPICKSSPEKIQSLRDQAVGRFISASYRGNYRAIEPAKSTGGTRRIDLDM